MVRKNNTSKDSSNLTKSGVRESRKREAQRRGYPNTSTSRGLYERGHNTWKWLAYLEALAMSRFKWENLPDSVDERFLERTLTVDGQSVFFMLGDKLRATRVNLTGPFDMYFNPESYQAIGDNGFTYEIPDGEGVVAWDSMTRKCRYQSYLYWADELAELDQLIRTNRQQQRNLVIFSGPEASQNDLAALTRDLQMNESTRITIGELDEHDIKIQAINTGIPYLQDKFHQDRTSLLNSIYSFMGIEHIPFEKSERLVAGEASAASDVIARMREDALVPRLQLAEQVNDKFGTNISVTWRSDMSDKITDNENYSDIKEDGDDYND